MAMLKHISEDLSKEDPSEFQLKMLEHVKNLVRHSRETMSRYYSDWDSRDMVYRGERKLDKEDSQNRQKGDPVKMVVPLSYSQVQTFVAFCTSLFQQRRYMFEISGNNMAGHAAAKVAEALLDRDLNHSQFGTLLYQLLLDVARFGVGVIKHGWVKETATVYKKTTQPALSLFGMSFGQPTESIQMTQATEFLGNRLYTISPFRFFPDVRFPLTRFQEGEFCASEDEYSYPSLRSMERNGLVAGVEFVPSMTMDAFQDRGQSRFNNFNYSADRGMMASQSKGSVILTEIQVDIVPSDFEVSGKPIGKEDYPVKYLVWYANDTRIIRLEPLGYVHNKFTYDVAQFSPDQHRLINESVSDMISQLQDVITWLINTRIASVRKSIANQFVADPSAIELKDFAERKTIIRVKPNASRQDVNKWIKQLNVSDVTTNHIGDVQALQQLMQVVTGISDNALGQFFSGRRSASEARAVNMASSSRLRLVAKLIYDGCLEPLARKMVSNLRDGLDEMTFVKLLGQTPDAAEAFNNFVQVDKTALIGDFDFDVFDGTLPTEKGVLADTLKETLLTIFQSPEATGILGLDLRKLFFEMLTLRGVKNIERFMVAPNPQQLAAMAAQQAQQNGQTATTPVPGTAPGTGNSLSNLILPSQVGVTGPV